MASIKSKEGISRKRASFIAHNVLNVLKDYGCRSMICGSLRRKKTGLVGDVDIVFCGDMEQMIAELQNNILGVEVVSFGAEQAKLIVGGVPVELYRSEVASFGAMTLFTTGSALFNIRCRARAKSRGFKLNQKGLWYGDELQSTTEQGILLRLGLIDYLPVEKREVV